MNMYGIVNKALSIQQLMQRIKSYQEKTLSVHSPKSFTVRKELENQPAVPRFICKQSEFSNFASHFGSIDLTYDLAKKYVELLRQEESSAADLQKELKTISTAIDTDLADYKTRAAWLS